jgi:hypothetical protein
MIKVFDIHKMGGYKRHTNNIHKKFPDPHICFLALKPRPRYSLFISKRQGVAGNHDFSVDQGTTWNRELTFAQDGVPINLTGFALRMQLRRVKSQTEYNFSLTTGNGGIAITDALAGKITIVMTAEQTALLSGAYFYDLELVSGTVVARYQVRLKDCT